MSKRMFAVYHTYEDAGENGHRYMEKTLFVINADNADEAKTLARINQYPHCRDIGDYKVEEVPRGVVRTRL